MFDRSPLINWLILIFFTCLYFASAVGIMNSLDAPEYALTQALVEKHSTRIDNFVEWSWPDYAQVDGHAYIKRPPGISIMATPFYLLARWLKPLAAAPYRGQHVGINADSPTEALVMFFPALAGGLTILLIYRCALFLSKSHPAGLMAAISLGLGTLLWRYSTGFYRQPVYLFLLVLSLYTLLKIKSAQPKMPVFPFLGFILGFTLVVESTAIFVVPLFVLATFYLTRKDTSSGLVFPRSFLALICGLIAAVSILISYNLLSFGQLTRNLYEDLPRTRWMSYSALSSTPLWPSLWINLFSHGSIPLEAFSPILRDNPQLFVQESANWAMVHPYQGIFVQSPYLVLALSGFIFFWRKERLLALLSLSAILATLIPLSKFVDFYSPNSYDTRLFLPLLPFLTLGLAFWWQELLALRNKNLQILGGSLTIFMSVLSIHRAWLSAIANYAPHVTGEHRFALEMLPQPWYALEHWADTLRLLLWHTFPNIYNLPAALLYFLIIAIGWWLATIFYTSFFNRVHKRTNRL